MHIWKYFFLTPFLLPSPSLHRIVLSDSWTQSEIYPSMLIPFTVVYFVIVSYNDVIIPMNLGSLTDRLDTLFTNKLSMHLPQWNIDSWLGNVWSQHDRSEFILYLHTPYENWKGEKIKKIEEERLVPHR